MKRPEEYILRLRIDTAAKVLSLGVLLFHFPGNLLDAELIKMFTESPAFHANRTRELGKSLYHVAMRAVCYKN